MRSIRNALRLVYKYDTIGNVKVITDNMSISPAVQPQHFNYDDDSHADATGGDELQGIYDQDYVCDETNGNLIAKGGLSLSYNDPDHAHAVTSAVANTYAYDENGNQVARVISDTYTLDYDAENRLVSVSWPSLSAQFCSDGDGRRVRG